MVKVARLGPEEKNTPPPPQAETAALAQAPLCSAGDLSVVREPAVREPAVREPPTEASAPCALSSGEPSGSDSDKEPTTALPTPLPPTVWIDIVNECVGACDNAAQLEFLKTQTQFEL
jgi:hypothetical protein